MTGRWHVETHHEFGHDVLVWNDQVIAQVTTGDLAERSVAHAELIACVHDAARWRDHQAQLAAAEARAAERHAWRTRRGVPQ